MSNVKITRMELHYFKGIRSLEVDFNDETEISGPNGCGKSTIADAFTWALFGKNMAGESDTKFLCKTVDKDGVEIPHVNHEVAITLDVDGKTVSLMRRMVPEYDKEDNLKGNHTEYIWNDVPLKKSEYDAKVKAIIDEDVFKLITSPFAFLTMDWKKQRDMLLSMAGTIQVEDIISQREDFAELWAQLSGKTIEEYKREIACKLQKVNEEMQSLPARVDEVKRGMPEAIDLAAIREERIHIEAEIRSVEDAEKSEADAISLMTADYMNKVKTLSDMKQKQFEILHQAEAAERAAIHEANTRNRDIEALKDALVLEERTDADKCMAEQNHLRSEMTFGQNLIGNAEKQLCTLRDEWQKTNASQFYADESLICPLFKHGCTDAQACARYDNEQGAAYEAFVSDKQQKIASINERGQALKAELEQHRKSMEMREQKILDIQDGYAARSKQRIAKLQQIEDQLKANPKRPLIASVKGTDIPEWVEMDKLIREFEASIQKPEESAQTSHYRERKMALRQRLADISRKEMQNDQIEAATRRIDELEARMKTLGAQKAMLEHSKAIADDFEIARMNEVGKKVNSMFSIVRWQMFQRQVNGENIPACVALVDGVRWTDANTAARINAGIDVASSLARVYDVSAPMFIDNAECSGYILKPEGVQRILLRFDRNEKELKVL